MQQYGKRKSRSAILIEELVIKKIDNRQSPLVIICMYSSIYICASLQRTNLDIIRYCPLVVIQYVHQ